MELKQYMNNKVESTNGNMVSLMAAFTEQVLLKSVFCNIPLSEELQNDIMAYAMEFVQTDEYLEAIKTKTNWED